MAKEQTKKTMIDLKNSFLIIGRRGGKMTLRATSQTHGINEMTLWKWQKEAPSEVSIMAYCLKHSKKTFPEIMKNIKGLDKCLDFIFDYCSETGLTFEELVIEI